MNTANDNVAEIHRTRYTKISADLKMRAIIYIERNPQISVSEAARVFSIKERTMRNIYAKYKADGSVIERPRGGARLTRLLETHKESIDAYLEQNPLLTLNEIKIRLLEDFNLTISNQTIARAIKSMKITYKLVRQVPVSRNSPENIEVRFIYCRQYLEQ